MAIATLTSKGQITIPKSVRERLGLQAGDQLEFVMQQDGSVRLRRRNRSLLDLVGMIKTDRHVTLEEMDEAIARGRAGQ
jgi:AbrB family looped-hinge helix DNA binding protein